MELSCPRCGCVHDVPEKAFLVWKRACQGCETALFVVATERTTGPGLSYLAFELQEVLQPPANGLSPPSARDEQPRHGANTGLQ